MTLNRTVCMLAAVAALLVAPSLALAEDAISHPAKKPIGPSGPTKDDMVASLAVLNAKGATLDGNTLTLTSVSRVCGPARARRRPCPDRAFHSRMG